MSASNNEQKMSKQLPCSLVIERALTVAGIERKAILSCGTDQHHVYCPAYYQNFIDDAENKLAECEAKLTASGQLQAEQESIVFNVGPITCRNGEQHERVEDCIYCALAECEQEKVELQANFDRVVEERNSSDDYISHLEHKLAAARELLQAVHDTEALYRSILEQTPILGTGIDPRVLSDLRVVIDGLTENLGFIDAALTEAGEGEK